MALPMREALTWCKDAAGSVKTPVGQYGFDRSTGAVATSDGYR